MAFSQAAAAQARSGDGLDLLGPLYGLMVTIAVLGLLLAAQAWPKADPGGWHVLMDLMSGPPLRL